MKDLVVLSPGKDDEFALRGLFSRPEALGIRTISVDYFRHPHKDPGCLNTPEALLRSQANRYSRALVISDREGSGVNDVGVATSLELQVRKKLSVNGWDDRAGSIVIEPELEAWVWSDSPHVQSLLGWGERTPSLRSWLVTGGWLAEGGSKPEDPKGAMEAAMASVQRQRSSAIYEQLARHVSLKGCRDEAFGRLCRLLREWFPAS